MTSFHISIKSNPFQSSSSFSFQTLSCFLFSCCFPLSLFTVPEYRFIILCDHNNSKLNAPWSKALNATNCRIGIGNQFQSLSLFRFRWLKVSKEKHAHIGRSRSMNIRLEFICSLLLRSVRVCGLFVSQYMERDTSQRLNV